MYKSANYKMGDTIEKLLNKIFFVSFSAFPPKNSECITYSYTMQVKQNGGPLPKCKMTFSLQVFLPRKCFLSFVQRGVFRTIIDILSRHFFLKSPQNIKVQLFTIQPCSSWPIPLRIVSPWVILGTLLSQIFMENIFKM